MERSVAAVEVANDLLVDLECVMKTTNKALKIQKKGVGIVSMHSLIRNMSDWERNDLNGYIAYVNNKGDKLKSFKLVLTITWQNLRG
jgi:hypothetical protein